MLALPRGRILTEVVPLLRRAGIELAAGMPWSKTAAETAAALLEAA